MNKSRFDISSASPGHEGTILASDVLPAGMNAPFSHAWGYLGGPGEMERHSHPASEVYFFFKGEGQVLVGGETEPVSPGDVVEIPAGIEHMVINASGGELLWAALWWD